MKRNPMVSIVIPVYNGSNYLNQAIDSVLSQTYRNIEIIVVNDGSNDNGKTEKIALSYGDQIRYFKQENGGVASALNLAINKMRGDYFSWLSHDDLYYPNKIEKQIEYLANNNFQNIVLYSDYDLIDENSNLISECIKPHEILKTKPEYALLRGHVNGITLLIPKVAFSKIGLFDERLRCTQDYDLWNKMIKHYNFIHLPLILSSTRIHNKQDSKISPKVIIEGEALWIKMIKDLSLEKMIRLENSEYKFYFEMNKFLKDTPYIEAQKYVEKRLQTILETKKKDLNNIKVSIVIPFLNRIDLLLDSLKSAMGQTHKNIEIILINDGSTDNLLKLNKIVKSDCRIKLITFDKNKGVSSARNKGIEEATGEYIALLDSDDLFVNEKIEQQLLQMILNDAIISHTSYIRRTGNKETLINSGAVTGNVKSQIIYACPIATPTVMVKRDYIIKNNIKYNEEYKIGEDVCFYLDILRHTNLLGIDKPLTIVNTNENSAGYNYNKQLEGLKTILSFVLNDKVYSKEDYSIACLAQYLTNFYFENDSEMHNNIYQNCENCKRLRESTSWRITKPLRGIKLIYSIVKTEGILKISKKIFNKSKKIIFNRK